MREKFEIKECPACGSGKIRKVRRDWAGESHGIRYKVPNLEYHECPECHEKVYDSEALQRIQEKSPAFRSQSKKRAA